MTKIRIRPRPDGYFEAHISDFPLLWNRVGKYVPDDTGLFGGYFRKRFGTREEALLAAKNVIGARRNRREAQARARDRVRRERVDYHDY